MDTGIPRVTVVDMIDVDMDRDTGTETQVETCSNESELKRRER